MNYGNKSEKVYVGKGAKMDEPKVGRAGYYLDGWFSAATDGTKFNFAETNITDDITLYAHWSEPTKYYELTATKGGNTTNDYDKFVLIWNPNKTVYPGDVLSFAFKSERLDDLTKDRSYSFSIRDAAKWFSEKTTEDEYPLFFSTFEEEDDGWTYVTYVFPSEGTQQAITYPATFQIHFRDNVMADGDTTGSIADKVFVKAVAVNGEALTLDKEKTSAKNCLPTVDEHDIEPEAPVVYSLTSTKADKRFQFKWDSVESSGGKVFTLKYKSANPIGTFTARDPSAGKYADGTAVTEYVSEPDGEDWITFSFTIPEGEHTGFGLALYETEAAAIGDILYIKDIYLGGEPLTLAQANSWAGNESTIVTVE